MIKYKINPITVNINKNGPNVINNVIIIFFISSSFVISKTFAIKIVLTSSDPAIVPSVKDLRIIATPAE